MKTKLPRLILLGLLTFSIPAVWAEDAASTAPSAASAPAEAAASAASAEAAPAPTEPQLIGVDKISAGDTAWMLTSTALVLMMTIPGLALFYGGMVRKKNVLATLMQSFAITGRCYPVVVVHRLLLGVHARLAMAGRQFEAVHEWHDLHEGRQ